MQEICGFQALGSNPALPTKRVKEAKTKVFQSFQKPVKNVVKPANPKIRRFFAFKAVFNFYKSTQKFCGKIVAHLGTAKCATEFYLNTQRD